MAIFMIVLSFLAVLALTVLYVKHYYWGPGGKAPSREDEEKRRSQPPPTTRPRW